MNITIFLFQLTGKSKPLKKLVEESGVPLQAETSELKSLFSFICQYFVDVDLDEAYTKNKYSNKYLNEGEKMNEEVIKKVAKDTCDTFCYDEVLVQRVQPEIEKVQGVELIFKALSDATRMKIAYALTLEKELCVCDVANIIASTTATASHHLRLLRNMKLAKYRKEGKLVFYSLADNHVHQLVSIALLHSKEV